METLIVWFNEIHWFAVLQIIMIDILLGGDNAVVIALACRDLDPHLRRKGIFYGAGGAIALRVILIAFAVTIMTIPYLKFCGGLLLLWIGIKLIVPHDEGDQEVHASKKLWGAVKTIIIADLVMSIDNVIAIAGAAEQAPGHHQCSVYSRRKPVYLENSGSLPDHCVCGWRAARLDCRHADGRRSGNFSAFPESAGASHGGWNRGNCVRSRGCAAD